MKQLHVTCPEGHRRSIPADEAWVGADLCSYCWWCWHCSDVIRTPADLKTVRLLRAGGVTGGDPDFPPLTEEILETELRLQDIDREVQAFRVDPSGGAQ